MSLTSTSSPTCPVVQGHQAMIPQQAPSSTATTSTTTVGGTMPHHPVLMLPRPVPHLPGHHPHQYQRPMAAHRHPSHHHARLPPPHSSHVPGHPSGHLSSGRSGNLPQSQPMYRLPGVPGFDVHHSSRSPNLHQLLAIHSHQASTMHDLPPSCPFVPIPLPPPPYSTLPNRGTNQRRLIDQQQALSHGHLMASSSSPPSCPTSRNGLSGTNSGTSPSCQVNNNASNNRTSTSSNCGQSVVSSFLRSLTSSVVNNNSRNGSTSNSNNGSNTGTSIQDNSCPSSSHGCNTSMTATGHRPLPPVLPSYHHLYASSSPSSIRRRRRQLRHSRLTDDDDNVTHNYLTENRKQLICISLLVIGSILSFVGLVTVSLFAISFGVTFGLFSFILYRLLPTSKYSPSIMSTVNPRISPRISFGGHPYVIASSSSLGPDGSCNIIGHLPPPPPSYQEAVSGGPNAGLIIHQLDPSNLNSGHTNSVHQSIGHQNHGFDMAHIQQHLVHHHHRQDSSISSVGTPSIGGQSEQSDGRHLGHCEIEINNHEVTVVTNSGLTSTTTTIESGPCPMTSFNSAIDGSSSSSGVKSLIAVGLNDHDGHLDGHSSVKSGLVSTNDSNTNNDQDPSDQSSDTGSTNRLHFITIIEATI